MAHPSKRRAIPVSLVRGQYSITWLLRERGVRCMSVRVCVPAYNLNPRHFHSDQRSPLLDECSLRHRDPTPWLHVRDRHEQAVGHPRWQRAQVAENLAIAAAATTARLHRGGFLRQGLGCDVRICSPPVIPTPFSLSPSLSLVGSTFCSAYLSTL